jgi:hypothetical protein
LGRAPLRLRRRSAFTLGVAAFIFLASSRLPRFDRLDRGRRVAIQHDQPSDARRIGHELRGIRRASLKDVAGADASSSDKSTNVTSDRVLEAFHVLNARVGKRRRHVTGRVATFPVEDRVAASCGCSVDPRMGAPGATAGRAGRTRHGLAAQRVLPTVLPNWANLTETELYQDGLNKPERFERTASRSYRTEEVAGSSPASSWFNQAFQPQPGAAT